MTGYPPLDTRIVLTLGLILVAIVGMIINIMRDKPPERIEPSMPPAAPPRPGGFDCRMKE